MGSIRYPVHPFCLMAPLRMPLPAANGDSVTKQDFGTAGGQPITRLTITNSRGMSIMNFDATVVKLIVPDRVGKMDVIGLGFGNLSGYLDPKKNPPFGASFGVVK
jgi:aldose 1-epimerase